MPRETYTVTFKDGHRQTFDGPPGMTDHDLVQRAQQERGFAGGDIATSFAGGATRHLLEDEPQTVNALLGGALTASGAGAPAAAAVPFVTSGLKRLSQLLATGHADAVGGGELAQDAVEGALAGYGGHALKAGSQLVGGAKDAVVGAAERYLPSIVRTALGRTSKLAMLDAATSKPVLSAAEQVGEGLTPEGIRASFRSVGGGMLPGVADDAPAASAGLQELTRRQSVRPSSEMAGYLRDRTASRGGSLAALTRRTGTGGPEAVGAADYGPFLDDLARQVEPPGISPDVAALASRTGTGGPSAVGEADLGPFIDALERRARPFPTPAPSAAATELASRTGTGGPGAVGEADYGPFLEALQRRTAKPVAARPATVPEAAREIAPAAPAGPAWMRAKTGSSFEPVGVEAADVGGAAADVSPTVGGGTTAAQRAQFSPAARAARATAPTEPPGVPDTPERQALIEELFNSPSFRALRRYVP